MLSILLITIGANSQTLMYRTSAAVAYDVETGKQQMRDDISYIIKFNTDSYVISVDNEAQLKFYLRDQLIEKNQKDEEGDDYTKFTFNAYDNEDARCKVYMWVYTEMNLTFFIVEYSNIIVSYYTTRIE